MRIPGASHNIGARPSQMIASVVVRTLAREKGAAVEPAAYSPGADADSISRGAVGEEAPARQNSRSPV